MKEAGTTVQAVNFCNAASGYGYDVSLVTAFDGGAFAGKSEVMSHFKSLGKTGRFEVVVGIYRFMKHIRQQRPDIIIAGAKRINLWAIIAKLLCLGKPKLIVTLTNDLNQKTKARPKGRRLEGWLIERVYKIANMTLVLTPQMKSKLIANGFPTDKLSYAPPPLDLSIVEKKILEPVDHPWLKDPKTERDIPVIVAIGRLSNQKNYPLLLKALAKANETKTIRLIVLGTGKAKKMQSISELTAKLNLENLVDFVGFKANPYPYLSRANTFALSSNWEGFGIVLLEALTCGTTIVSSNCPTGPSHILGNGSYGYLSTPENVDEFANALIKSLSHPMDPHILKNRAETFNIKAVMALHDKAIKKVQAQRP